MIHDTHPDVINRLKWAHGHLASTIAMIEDARPGEPRRPLGGSATHLHISAESAL